MANLNDVNRKITEITNALQNLSDDQMKSVERSVFGYLDIRDLIQKKEKAQTKFSLVGDQSALLLKRAEDTAFKKKISFFTSYDNFFSNGKKKLLSASKAVEKLSKSKQELKSVGVPKKDITKDTTNAFLREKDSGNSEQIELLKNINEKIGALTSPKSGGLLDFVFSALPKILSLAGMAEGAGALGAGAAGLGILGKYGKFIPKIGKIGKAFTSGAGKVISKTKTPAGIALGVGAGSLMALGAISSDEGSPIEQRYTGGPVTKGKPYIVGELGAEIFVPNSNGKIVSNQVAGKLTPETLSKFSNNQTEKIDTSLSKTLGVFSKPFDKNMKTYTKKVIESSNTLEEKLVKGFQYIKDGATVMVNNAVTKIEGLLPDFIKNTEAFKNAANQVKASVGQQSGQTNINIIPPTPVAGSQPPLGSNKNVSPAAIPQNYSGAFKVPETGIRKIHNGEMVVPAFQSEMIRAAAELRNDYSIKSTIPKTSKMKLDEKFWMEKFVPAFAKAIKVDKKNDYSTKLMTSTANPFG